MRLNLKPTRKKVNDFILSAILCYIAFGAVLYFMQADFIYIPDTRQANMKDIGARPVGVRTADGMNLVGWYIDPAPGKPVAILFHGNAGSIQMRGFQAAPFVRQGMGFLFAEYRGYGGNPGQPSEEGLYNDARAYIRYLREKEDIKESRMIMFGESLGSGVAVKMAEENPDIAAVILLTPYTSLAAVAQRLYPIYPAPLMVKDNFDNLTRISAFDVPILLLHGRKDTTIPFVHSEKLAAAAAKADLVAFEEGGHNNLYMLGAEAAISGFIKKL